MTLRQIEGYPLWVGTARDARDLTTVLAAGIEAVVDLATLSEPVVPPRELVYLRFPLVDGGDNPPWELCAAIQAVAGLVRLGVPTLVVCDGGMSRAVVIASAATWFQTPLKTSLDEVLEKCAAAGPCDVQPRLWMDVKRYVFSCAEAHYCKRT
ncbi:MAG: hypothetical protein RMJ56_08305 [Gemmataceae bacterium]|nr:hypothetical protein [Gemmata sp.]MDW8197593.1 hypothetical protein [Gemmataceae bacterium]